MRAAAASIRNITGSDARRALDLPDLHSDLTNVERNVHDELKFKMCPYAARVKCKFLSNVPNENETIWKIEKLKMLQMLEDDVIN